MTTLRSLIALVYLALSVAAGAQTNRVIIDQTGTANNVDVNNNTVSEAMSVRCVNAAQTVFVECGLGGAGTTDTDDGSIGGGQVVGLSAALTKVWNGSAWVRLTLGPASNANSLSVVLSPGLEAYAVMGDIQHGESDSGPGLTLKPIKIGGVANTTAPGAVTAGDRVQSWFTPVGSITTNLRTAAGAELLGQQLMTASVPVALASNHSSIAVDLPPGASTAAAQGTGNTSLAAIDGKLNEGAVLPATTADATAVRAVPQERVGTGALGALFDEVVVELTGFASIGGTIDAGTLAGTVSFQGSTDGGLTYSTVVVNGPLGTQVSTLVLTNPSAKSNFEFFVAGQTTHMRVRVTAYTSGTANAQIRASTAVSALAVGSLSAGMTGVTAPFYRTFMGGVDSSGLGRSLEMRNAAPTGAEYTPLVRQIADPMTANAPAASSVGVASGSCLATNASRKAAFFMNTSAATISIAESGQAAVLNSGITLAPGQTYNMVPPFVTTGQVNCIASAAASNLSIMEKQ